MLKNLQENILKNIIKYVKKSNMHDNLKKEIFFINNKKNTLKEL